MTHIARVLTLVLVILFTCTAGLAACAPVNEAVLAITPEPTSTTTATPTPDPTPSPTPTSEPTPTPMPELTLEQKELLLGINDTALPITVNMVRVYNYTFNGKKYRCWTYGRVNEKKTNESPTNLILDQYDLFTGEFLFSISLPNKGIDTDGQSYSTAMNSHFLFETNPALSGMKLELSFGLAEVATYYKIWEVDYNDDQFLNDLEKLWWSGNQDQMTEALETFLSVDQQKQVFLNSTPQEEIMPFWVYTPGAQIPEELKGIYSEVDYPPAPAE